MFGAAVAALAVIMMIAGLAMFVLAVLAEANHPLGGNETTGRLLKGAIATLLIGLMLLLSTSWAKAEPAPGAPVVISLCAPWPQFKEQFRKRHGEVPIGGGLVNGKAVLQVLASAGGATWSIVAVDRSGIACLTAAGKGWEPGTLPIAGKDT